MQEELNMFAEYKEKLAGVVGDEAAAGIVADSLFLVCAGTDDIANNYYLAPVRPLQYDISAYVDFLVEQACDFMRVKSSFPLATQPHSIQHQTMNPLIVMSGVVAAATVPARGQEDRNPGDAAGRVRAVAADPRRRPRQGLRPG